MPLWAIFVSAAMGYIIIGTITQMICTSKFKGYDADFNAAICSIFWPVFFVIGGMSWAVIFVFKLIRKLILKLISAFRPEPKSW